MKKIITKSVYVLFIALLSLNVQNSNAQEQDMDEQKIEMLNDQQKEKKINVTYKGLNVSDNFRFTDNKGQEIVFHDESLDSPSKLSLFDEELIGKRFVVHYKWVDVMLFDKNTGLTTGKTMKVKRITNFNYVNYSDKNLNAVASNK
ncbi:hypothetical protein H9I45_10530 [Polaribacter haliotis]|uniref:Uncharacterized protein n=1 Tax=Polaribacter haliotis TaxID=1888915 RepID=A0A7L8ACQ1_9FLAO|nr:hypothetical protein [Polaribacter haliotis]QOD59785.1 hypothetical protein H9I45_10530 [Polaribacter haliotis]